MTTARVPFNRFRLTGEPLVAIPEHWLVGAIAVSLIVQAILVPVQSVNWDEFRFLSDVHAYRRGELSEWLQTLHVQLFFWLPSVSISEVDQVIVARAVMFLLKLGTIFLIYWCARRFMDHAPALLAILVYLGGSYVIRHGSSFRFDPIATFLLMTSLALLLGGRTRLAEGGAGAMAALAGLVTVKSVLFVPTLLIAAICRQDRIEDWRASLHRLAVIAGVGLLTFVGIAWLHASSLAAEAASGQEVVTHGFRKTIAEAGLLPRNYTLVLTLVSDPLVWASILAGLSYVLFDWRTARQSRARFLTLLGMSIPLLSILIYRNAFAYYYVMMLAPASILAGYAAMRLGWPQIYLILSVILGALSILHGSNAWSRTLAVQREHIDALHRIFPEPVAYIDRASMVSSFPKKGFFMSSWGIENYLQAGRPIMREILLADAPAFVLANSPLLTTAMTGAEAPGDQLLREDAATLRANFIHHWGALWVAGKSIQVDLIPSRFELLVEGLYTVETSGPILLNGARLENGQSVRLAQGRYELVSMLRPQRVTLRYGRHLHKPAARPTPGSLFGRL